ncbi:MAG: exo-alpha-sialidase [Bacteroidota bacterium]
MKSIQLFIIILFSAITGITSAQTNYNLSDLSFSDGEPYIAVNPANQNNIIAGWMRLRLDGKIWIATRASFDKGQTWSVIGFMPHDTFINNSADVIIAFHNSGIAYLSYVDYRTSPDSAGGVFLSISTDGGLTWDAPNKVFDKNETPDMPIDRPWIAVDNSGGVNDGTVFVTSMSAYFYDGQHHIYLKTSADSGVSWSTMKQVDDSLFSVGPFKVSYAPVSVGGEGKVYIAYMSYVSLFVKKFYIATTTDMGNTFQIYDAGDVYPAFAKLPAYTLSADPVNNGHVILSWCDTRFGDLDVLLSKSTDGGQTWATPVRMNDDTVNNGIVQDQVWADFSPSGNLAVAWRDRRLNGAGLNVPFDIYTTLSTDAANTFSPNYRVTTVSSPYSAVTCCNSFIGVAAADSSIYMNWGDYRNGTDWDVYFNKTDIATLITSANDVSPAVQSSFDIFPNPANNSIQVSFSSPSSKINSEIIIFNSLGQVMKIIPVSLNQSGIYSKQIDISHFPYGGYYLFIKSDNSFSGNRMFFKSWK